MNQSNIYEYLEGAKVNITSGRAIVCCDDKEAKRIADVAILLEYETFVLPDIRVSVGDDLRSFGEEISELLVTLHGYYSSQSPKILISPIRTTLLPLPREEYFSGAHHRVWRYSRYSQSQRYAL